MRFLDSTLNYSEPQISGGGSEHSIEYKLSDYAVRWDYQTDPSNRTSAKAGESITARYICNGDFAKSEMYIGWQDARYAQSCPKNTSEFNEYYSFSRGASPSLTFTMPDYDVTVWIMSDDETM